MVAAGVQPDAYTWSTVIAGYSSGAEKERALERMVAAGVQPNVLTYSTIMGGFSSFFDRARLFHRMTSGVNAVSATAETMGALFGCPDVSDHMQTVLDITRALSVDLLCDHRVLGKLLPLCAEGNDTQLLRRLWDIGAAGLSGSKLGWPGLQNPGMHYQISKFMRERRPQGGGWLLLSLLMRGSSGACAAPTPGGSAAVGTAPAAAAGGGRGVWGGRGGGGGGARGAGDGGGRVNSEAGSFFGGRGGGGGGRGSPCKNWTTKGSCTFGEKCHFSHR
jgi:hypothetical protein